MLSWVRSSKAKLGQIRSVSKYWKYQNYQKNLTYLKYQNYLLFQEEGVGRSNFTRSKVAFFTRSKVSFTLDQIFFHFSLDQKF